MNFGRKHPFLSPGDLEDGLSSVAYTQTAASQFLYEPEIERGLEAVRPLTVSRTATLDIKNANR